MAQQQYPTPDSIILETFIVNAIRMSIEHQYLDYFGINFLKFERVVTDNQVLESVLDKSTSSPNIEPGILDQLEK